MELYADHIGSLRLQTIIDRLASVGCVFAPPTNEWEVFRCRHPDGTWHILYKKKNGRLTWQIETIELLRTFEVEAEPKIKKSRNSARKRARQRLLERDGPDCWFCGGPMGDDMTVEHLVPKSQGGPNTLANLVLTHSKCNQLLDDHDLQIKLKMKAEYHENLVPF